MVDIIKRMKLLLVFPRRRDLPLFFSGVRFLSVVLFSVIGSSHVPAFDRIAVLDSRMDHKIYADQDEEIREERPLLWRNLLQGYFERVQVISDEDLEEPGLREYGLLILPEVRVLTPLQQEAVMDFLNRGNALILTGRGGVESTDPRLERALADELGLDYRPVEHPGGGEITSWWVVTDEPAYLTADIPVLQHLAVEQKHPVTLAAASGEALAFWMSAGADTEETFDEAAHRSALSYGRLGAGKFLWLSFPIESVGGDLETSQNFHRLLSNAFAWFRDRAVVEIESWPYPYRQAAVFSMDTETAFGNIRDVYRLENLTAMTYFLLTDPLDLYVDILRRIAGEPSSELASGEMAVHGDDHDVFRGQSREEQTARLRRTVDYIQEKIGIRPFGFRPPEEAYDYTTLNSLLDTGFEYIFADDNPIRNTPRIISIADQRLVQLPRLNKDDIEIIVKRDMLPPDEALDAYIEDVDQIFRREGVYLANLHTHVLASSDYIGVLENVLDYVLARDPWYVNCLELVRWWLRRDAVELEVLRTSPGDFRFRIVNKGDEKIEDLGFSLWLPGDGERVRLEIFPGDERVLDYQRPSAARLRFSLPELRPNDEREYRVRW